jgi:peptidoglycan/LPS O-acetylase OafA/YrhL
MKRLVEMDSLRGLAAILVLVGHMHGDWFSGWSRVELFLVLSGFLLTSLVLKKIDGPGAIRDLVARRSLRIWPAYLVAIGLVILLNPLFNTPFKLDGLPYYLCFLQNLPRYWGAEPPDFPLYLRHTWTLAVIEQFHLLWPIALLVLGRRWGALAAVGLIVGSLVARSVDLHPWLLAARADGLALGSLLAIAMADPQFVQTHRRGYVLGLSGLSVAGLALVLTAALEDGRWAEYSCGNFRLFGCGLTYTGLLGLVALASGHPLLAPFRHPRLLALGTISYGIYLLHPLAIVTSGRLLRLAGFEGPTWLLESLQIAASLAAATALYLAVERPIRALRDRLATPARRARPSAVAVRPT